MLDAAAMSIAPTGMRRRKAWAIRTDWTDPCDPDDILFAPTASKAKGLAIHWFLDAGIPLGEAFRRMRCRRAPEHDVLLPPRHPLADRMGPELLALVTHAFGGTGLKAGYRDYFYTEAGDWDFYRLVTDFGMFDGPHNVGKPDPDGRRYGYFHLTDLGKQVARSVQPEYPRHA